MLSSATGWPTAGWLEAGGQLISWTGISSATLTGIPGTRATTVTRSSTTATATTTGNHGFVTDQVVTITGAVQPAYNGAHKITVTGLTTFTFEVAGAPATPATGTIVVAAAGAILASIPGGSGAVTAPFLSGVSGLAQGIEKGTAVRICLVRDDAAAQTALAALIAEGDGIFEGPVLDDSTLTQEALENACDAELEVFSAALKSVTFRSRDPKLKAGQEVAFNLGGDTNVVGDFMIQRVVSSEFEKAVDLMPLREVTAGPVLLTLRNRLRRGGSATR